MVGVRDGAADCEVMPAIFGKYVKYLFLISNLNFQFHKYLSKFQISISSTNLSIFLQIQIIR